MTRHRNPERPHGPSVCWLPANDHLQRSGGCRFRVQLAIAALTVALTCVFPAQSEDAPTARIRKPASAVHFARRDVQRLATQQAPRAAQSHQQIDRLAQSQKEVAALKLAVAKANQQVRASRSVIQTTIERRQQAMQELQAIDNKLSELRAQLEVAAKRRATLESLAQKNVGQLVTSKQRLMSAVDAVEQGDESSELLSQSKVIARLAQEVAQGLEKDQTLSREIQATVLLEATTRSKQEAARRSQEPIQLILAETQEILATANQVHKRADASQAAAAQDLQKLESVLPSLQNAAETAYKQLVPLEQAANIAQERLRQLEAAPAKPVPNDIREIKVFTHKRPLYSCRFDDWGEYVFAGAFGNEVQRWTIYDGAQQELVAHKSWVRRMTFDPSGTRLLTVGYEGRMIWWDALTPAPVPQRTIQAHQGFARGVAVSPDGKLVATCGNDLLVRVWSAADGTEIKKLTGHARHVYNLRFSPNGSLLVSGDLMGKLLVWDVASWKQVRQLDAAVLSKYDTTFRADCGGIRGMDFHPDGRLLVVSGISKVTNAFAGVGEPTVVLFDLKSGKQQKVLKKAGFRGACWGVKWHPSGEFLVGSGGGTSGALWFWKPDNEKPFHEFKLPNVGYALDFHPDGLRLAVALYDKTLRIYDLAPRTPTEVALAAAAKQVKKK